MRVTTEFWVSALLKRVFSDGGFAAVLSKGAVEAGAVHIITRSRFGEVTLFRPAPQTDYDSAKPSERLFSRDKSMTPEEVDARLEKERRFDTDIWVVELEPGRTPVEELIEIAEE